ncbi:aldehyde dehydrogenase family 3 member A2-like isoform X2 [Coccinella septempunctata]|nr:aldehyde dehydrogenase family 3 member A2-like isoform X2 [Coccinella septempunctata]
MQNPSEMLANLRNSFNSGLTRPLKFRERQLNNIIKLVEENTNLILDALRDDLHKSTQESMVCEIEILKNDALNMIHNLSDWSKPRSVEKDLVNIMDKVQILPEPYGVVLVVGAWNYPLTLALSPLIGAIAAGNCVIVKPSELSPATAKIIAELLPKYLDTNCYKVFLGGPAETQQLLQHRFDYIFYTGSTRVGAIVAQCAAKNLTPTTLELGGKSPCYLDSTVDMDIAAARIFWGKALNSGQTCIAPDYVLCSQEVEKKFIEAFKKAQKTQFGEDMKDSPDYCRIINNNHFNRLVGLLEGQEIAHGGHHDASQRYIEPTICVNVDPNSPLMKDEIFGPILPIIRVNNAAEAISFINAREKPLALYVFSNDKSLVNLFEEQTSSGGVCVNDTIMHFACDALPFGGVGNSGLGAYHGKFSFDTFSHQKPILEKSIDKFGEMLQSIRYAPYSEGKIKALSLLSRKRKLPIPREYISHILLVVFGFFVCYLYFMIMGKHC